MKRIGILVSVLGLALLVANCNFSLFDVGLKGCKKVTLVDSTRSTIDTTLRIDTVHTTVCVLP